MFKHSMVGLRFGRWLVLSQAGKSVDDACIRYNCICDCGTQTDVGGASLRAGTSKSCGCLNIEKFTERATKHGFYGHFLYHTWNGMMDRCSNPSSKGYPRYGGRGISVCPRWHSVDNFISDNEPLWSDGLTLDRENNDGNYEPSNCRWVTRKVQQNNRSSNNVLSFNGRSMTASQWAESLGISRNCLYARLKKGYTLERALTMEKQKAYRGSKSLPSDSYRREAL